MTTSNQLGAKMLTDEQIDELADEVIGAGTRLSYAKARQFARALLSASKPAAQADAAIAAGEAREQEPVGWLIDPGAGSAVDRFQQVEPYGWQYDEVEKRGGSITPLYAAPQPPQPVEAGETGLTRYRINLEDGTDSPDECGGYYRDADVHARVGDLAMLIRRLVHSLHKAAPGNALANRAVDYLKRKGLSGSPLRDSASPQPVLDDERATGYSGFNEFWSLNWGDFPHTEEAEARHIWEVATESNPTDEANGGSHD